MAAGSFAAAIIARLSSRGKLGWKTPCLSVYSFTFASTMIRTSTPRSMAAASAFATGS